ncbi:MAG: hypothetical protein CME19_00040 [Gemmatimonadetes bacterium]|nr:hypothetical protein [Gemmatimonadota bacterium]
MLREHQRIQGLMQNIKAVIFDLDGTIFDLAPLVRAARERVATLLYENTFFDSQADAIDQIESLERKHGPYYSSSPYYFAFYDIAKDLCEQKPDACHAFLGDRNERRRESDTDEIESFVRILEQAYNHQDVETIKPFPDAIQTLEELKAAGCHLVLLSLGRPSRQQNKIDRLGIAPYFHRIINEGPPSHDYWINEVLEDNAFAPEEVVIVGDRTQDEIRSGNTLGLTTVWLKRGRFGEIEPGEGDRPDYTIGFLSQLSTLVHLARSGKDSGSLRTVVIGGGTGLPTVLRGIRTYDKSPTAIVAVTDTGASSGRIRWNLGVQPPGDIRNALTALSDPTTVSPGLYSVFHHRFPNDEAQSGIFKNDHIGNFLVAALTQQTGSFQNAIQTASEMLGVQGTILPSSIDNVDICAELEDGEHRYTEWMVRKPGKPPLKEAYLLQNADILAELDRDGGALTRIIDEATGQVEVHAPSGESLAVERNTARAPSEAADAIRTADLVILGPGSLFTSVITNLLVPEIRQALIDRDLGKTLYVCNITTQPGQSDGFEASDHLRALMSHLPEESRDSLLDHVLVQDPRIFESEKGQAWAPLLEQYAADGKVLVACDQERLDQMATWTRADFVEEFSPDVMDRGVGDFISHDSNKAADAVCRTYCGLPIPDYWGLGDTR